MAAAIFSKCACGSTPCGSAKLISTRPRYGGMPWSLHDSKRKPPVTSRSPAARTISLAASTTCAIVCSSDNGSVTGHLLRPFGLRVDVGRNAWDASVNVRQVNWPHDRNVDLTRRADVGLPPALRQQIIGLQRSAMPRHDVCDAAQRIAADVVVVRMVLEAQPVMPGDFCAKPDGAEAISRRIRAQSYEPAERIPDRLVQDLRHRSRLAQPTHRVRRRRADVHVAAIEVEVSGAVRQIRSRRTQ